MYEIELLVFLQDYAYNLTNALSPNPSTHPPLRKMQYKLQFSYRQARVRRPSLLRIAF